MEEVRFVHGVGDALDKVQRAIDTSTTELTAEQVWDTWDEFREAGMLWWINRILHTFGWSIVVSIDEYGKTISAFPARTKYRGFAREDEEEGYIKVSSYINSASEELVEETKDVASFKLEIRNKDRCREAILNSKRVWEMMLGGCGCHYKYGMSSCRMRPSGEVDRVCAFSSCPLLKEAHND